MSGRDRRRAAGQGEAAAGAPTGAIDGQLVEWGARLLYPRLRSRGRPDDPGSAGRALTAHGVRDLLRRVTAPGARQVMLNVTGGGRGLRAFSAHLRYISRLGKVEKGRSEELEDESGRRIEGAAALRELAQDWRTAGSLIPEQSHRREVLNIVLSMPAGTPPEAVRDAARDFAAQTFEGHKWVMALHTDTPAPHVHLAVRVEGADRVRLQPRREHLRAWRTRFADRLQDRGVNAIALPGRMMPVRQRAQGIGVLKARAQGRARSVQDRADVLQPGGAADMDAWRELVRLMHGSTDDDRRLAAQIEQFIGAHDAASRQREGRAGVKGLEADR